MPWQRPEELRQKTVPMRILNLGMSRTGTTSMCLALEMLGCVSCYHLDYDSDDCAFWLAAMEAKFEGKGKPFGKQEWDHIFSEFDAISDLPAILFASELARAYPEAKILLSIRDEDSWYQSMIATVCNPIYKTWYHRFPALVFPKEQALCDMSDKCEEIAWSSNFPAHGRDYYREHNRSVREMVPNEEDKQLKDRRFLEWRLGEGWTRLASFLGRDVPTQQYPGGNSVKEFLQEADMHARQMWVAVGEKTIPWVVLASGVAVLTLWTRVKSR